MSTSRSGVPRITVVGSVNMDLIATVESHPEAGETVLGTSLTRRPGGKGANQAVAAARAGGRVAFIGALGDDEYTDALRADLADAGVDLGALRSVPGPCGVALITVDARGENRIVVAAGANASLDQLTDTDRALIRASAVTLAQLEIPLSAVMEAATAAGSTSSFVLNASPARRLPDELAESTDVLIVNRGEARQLGRAVDTVPHVVTTLGAQGAHYRGPDRTGFTIPAPQVTVVDSTGAGDSFAGAFAHAWARGDTPRDAVRLACEAGAQTASRPGARPAPDR